MCVCLLRLITRNQFVSYTTVLILSLCQSGRLAILYMYIQSGRLAVYGNVIHVHTHAVMLCTCIYML